MNDLATTAMARIAEATAGHQPGAPYIVCREAFSRFWREELPDYPSEGIHESRSDLWVAIASHEARRQFQTGWDQCHSELALSTETGGLCQWWYRTTSGTILVAIDWRDADPPRTVPWEKLIEEIDPYLDWENNKWENNRVAIGPDGLYMVIIPAERDQPGRTAWTQLRLAMSGLSYRCWAQENKPVDDVAAVRAWIRNALAS